MTELTIIDDNSGLMIAGDLAGAFADFLRLNVADGDASPKTIASYQTEVRQYSQWCEAEGVSPARADEDNIRDYRRYLIETNYTRGTIGTKLAALKRFYEAAVWRGLRPDNPAAGIKAPKDKTAPEDKIKFLPLAGFKQILNITDNERDTAILALMGMHGLRVDEVCRLSLDDLTLSDPAQILVTGKGNKQRRVHLVATSEKVLRTWLKLRPEVETSSVFVSQSRNVPPGPLTTRAVRYVVDKYLDHAGLKDAGISCHSLRHSFATWSLAGGAKLEALSAVLGHSSIQTTLVYAKVVDKIKENPARYLESMLTGA